MIYNHIDRKRISPKTPLTISVHGFISHPDGYLRFLLLLPPPPPRLKTEPMSSSSIFLTA